MYGWKVAERQPAISTRHLSACTSTPTTVHSTPIAFSRCKSWYHAMHLQGMHSVHRCKSAEDPTFAATVYSGKNPASLGLGSSPFTTNTRGLMKILTRLVLTSTTTVFHQSVGWNFGWIPHGPSHFSGKTKWLRLSALVHNRTLSVSDCEYKEELYTFIV
jgi:hypothetical protein